MTQNDLSNLNRSGVVGIDPTTQFPTFGVFGQVPCFSNVHYGVVPQVQYGQNHPFFGYNCNNLGFCGFGNTVPQSFVPNFNLQSCMPTQFHGMQVPTSNIYGSIPFQHQTPWQTSMFQPGVNFGQTGMMPFTTSINPFHNVWGFTGICR